MKEHKFAFSVTCIAALLVATPAMGQLINFPVLALPAGDADGVTSVGAGYARGLNDDSGKQSAFGAGVARAMERVSFGVAGGYVATDTDELTLAGRVAVHLLNDEDQPVTVSVQTGLGWMSLDVGTESLTLLNIPVGVALSGSTSAGSATVRPWVMPRVQFTRASLGGTSNTNTDFGGSAGVGIVTEGGFGFGVSGDILIVDDGLGGNNSEFLFGAGVFYRLP